MRSDIHPQYYPKAEFKCACGKSWAIGSTTLKTSVSICANCHPFYTGTEKIIDTRGRVEKFKKKMEKVHVKAQKAKK